jgi:type II secretory pathway predicted ATPase ExeA
MLYKNKSKNKNTVIVIDEAQVISVESLEELRLLLNFQLNDIFLFTLILLGQPELKTKINDLPQLRQRFSIRYHLKALTEDQTREYIQHRLKVAGAEEEIFRDDAYSEIYRFSGGIPRRINNICDLALLVGCAEALEKIDKEIITDVAEDLEEMPIDKPEEVKVIVNG